MALGEDQAVALRPLRVLGDPHHPRIEGAEDLGAGEDARVVATARDPDQPDRLAADRSRAIPHLLDAARQLLFGLIHPDRILPSGARSPVSPLRKDPRRFYTHVRNKSLTSISYVCLKSHNDDDFSGPDRDRTRRKSRKSASKRRCRPLLTAGELARVAAFHRPRRGLPHLGRRRQRVHRHDVQLGPDRGRLPAAGGRGGGRPPARDGRLRPRRRRRSWSTSPRRWSR